jgi:sodium transport system permease protein
VSVDLRTVRLVAKKELLESLRDRRTLFVALLLPVLLYPLMMLAIAPLVNLQKQKLHDEAQPIALTGGGAADVRRIVLDAPAAVGDGEKDPPPAHAGLDVVATAEPRADLAAAKVALWVEAPAGFAGTLAKEGTADVTVHWDGSDDKSLTAKHKFDEALRRAEKAEVGRRIASRSLPESWLTPIRATADDVAPPARRAAYLFGKMLAFVLVVLTLSSSFYPAVDAVAGEKERGTMETLLVAPCGRTELVLGKFLAVLAVTLVAATLNLASMGLTLGPLMGVIAPDVGTGIVVTPGVLFGILALLLPLSALFSAVSLALSTLARSVKEGQHYLTPLFLVVMPLAMVVVLPNVPLTPALAPVPVTNAVLFFRDLLLGKTDATTTAIVMVTSFAYAAAALWACVSLFLREETLFRGPEGGTALFTRPAPRERPGGGAAMALFAAGMAVAWYGRDWLPVDDIVRNAFFSQVLMLLAPLALLSVWLRIDPRTTFRLRAPGLAPLGAAVAIGLAAPVLNETLIQAVGASAPSAELRRIGDQMTELARTSPVLAALLLGALPAVSEELFFRGFMLTGLASAFRGRGAAARAVVVTAAAFALYHILPEKWLPTFLMGLVLGLLAARTGSIWPGVVAHVLNNVSAVLEVFGRFRDPSSSLFAPSFVTAAALVFCAGVAVLLLAPARRDAAA